MFAYSTADSRLNQKVNYEDPNHPILAISSGPMYYPQCTVPMYCTNVLSRKFWSAEISVRRTKITGKIGPPGPNFPGKIGPTLEIMVRV